MPTLLRATAVVAFVLSTALAHAQECATGPAPACGGTCQAGSVCTTGQSGTPCECVAGTPLEVSKLSVKLNFAKPLGDTLKLQTLISIPADFVVAGRMVVVDLGGVVRTFVLDEKGAAKSEGTQIKLAVKAKKGVVAAQVAKLAFKGTKGSWADDWADEGLTNVTVDDQPVQMHVEVRIDTQVFATATPTIYKATQGKSGKAYLSK